MCSFVSVRNLILNQSCPQLKALAAVKMLTSRQLSAALGARGSPLKLIVYVCSEQQLRTPGFLGDVLTGDCIVFPGDLFLPVTPRGGDCLVVSHLCQYGFIIHLLSQRTLLENISYADGERHVCHGQLFLS